MHFQRPVRASMRSMFEVPNQTRLGHSNALECPIVQPGAANHGSNLVELPEVRRSMEATAGAPPTRPEQSRRGRQIIPTGMVSAVAAVDVRPAASPEHPDPAESYLDRRRAGRAYRSAEAA